MVVTRNIDVVCTVLFHVVTNMRSGIARIAQKLWRNSYLRLHTRNRKVQGGSNMTWTNCDLFTHKQSRSYLNHLVYGESVLSIKNMFHSPAPSFFPPVTNICLRANSWLLLKTQSLLGYISVSMNE
jgi:hypothetical protein